MVRIKNTLGIDIGGTGIKAGFLPGPGPQVLNFNNYPTPQKSDKLIILLKKIIKDFKQQYPIKKIGVGCPGPLDLKKGIVVKTPHLPLWGWNIQKTIKAISKLPVYLDNDANVFVLAESYWGAGCKYKHVIGLTLGTGLGGGIIINKKIYHGHGNAGEFGYMLIKQGGRRGLLGNKGSAQEYVRIGQLFKSNFIKKNCNIDIKKLSETYNQKTNLVWKKYGRTLGYITASLSHILDPDIIIFGGQITKAWPRFKKHLYTTYLKNCILPKPPVLALSKLGDQAGVIGAALLTINTKNGCDY